MKSLIPFLLITTILALPVAVTANEVAPQGKVNLNTASTDQLQLLPRVGPALASQIIEFRETNGPFRSVDELLAVKGIGETSLRNLSPYISVSGETSLSEKVRLPRASGTGSEAS